MSASREASLLAERVRDGSCEIPKHNDGMQQFI